MLKLVSIDGTDLALVTLDEAKDQCYVTGTDHDSLIATLITVAREYAEARTWRQLIEATYIQYLDEFPGGDEVIELPKPPVISVDSIKYYDSNDTLQTLSTDDYQVDINSEPARIRPANGSWPSVDDRMNAVEITFKAGYQPGGNDDFYKIPGKMKQAMLLMIKHWFDNREAVVVAEGRTVAASEVPMTANALLDFESVREFV